MRKVHAIGIPVMLLGLGAQHAIASTITESPDSTLVAFITCRAIPYSYYGCTSPEAQFGLWRVVNGYSGSPVDLEDVSLTFDAGGQTLTWTWDVLGMEIVETDPFPIALLSNFTSLRFQATLAETVLPFPPYTKFIADSPTLSATATRFPPPLQVSARGTFVTEIPIPEPATFFTVVMGLIGFGIGLRRSRRSG